MTIHLTMIISTSRHQFSCFRKLHLNVVHISFVIFSIDIQSRSLLKNVILDCFLIQHNLKFHNVHSQNTLQQFPAVLFIQKNSTKDNIILNLDLLQPFLVFNQIFSYHTPSISGRLLKSASLHLILFSMGTSAVWLFSFM